MKKKTFLPALVCLLILTSGYTAIAQEEQENEFNSKKFQISIGIADIFAKNNWWYSYWYADEYGSLLYPYPDDMYYRQPNLVLGFKYHGNKGAWRLGLNSRYSSSTFEDSDGTGRKYSYSNFGLGLGLGYEWHSTFGRLNVYYGFDASVSHTTYCVESELMGTPIVSTDKNTNKETAYGLNPLLGINFFITPNFSIGTEVKFSAEYISGEFKHEETNDNPYNPNYEESGEKRTGFRTYFGPLGFLSLNIHL